MVVVFFNVQYELSPSTLCRHDRLRVTGVLTNVLSFLNKLYIYIRISDQAYLRKAWMRRCTGATPDSVLDSYRHIKRLPSKFRCL